MRWNHLWTVTAAAALGLGLATATLADTVPGAPKASDVIFSSRWPRGNALSTAAAFHATRFDWVYIDPSDSSDMNWLAQVQNAGYGVGVTFSPSTIDQQKAIDEGWVAIDWQGNYLTLPHFQDAQSWYPDTNDPQYYDVVLNKMKAFVDAGITRFQWDDPTENVGLIPYGGVYSPASVAQFNGYLAANTTASQRSGWGVPADVSNFNYKDYVVAHNGPDNVASSLQSVWRAFQTSSVKNFFNTLRQDISAYAGYDVPFSTNNYGGNWGLNDAGNPSVAGNIYKLFDYGIAELPVSDATPSNLLNRIHQARAAGKAQAFTLVSSDVRLNRNVIAYTYAIGSHMVVPWDVYPGNTTDGRFFGDPADFADLYGFVRDHATLYDDYEDLAYAGPDVTDVRYDSITDPVSIHTSSGMLYAFLRSKASDPDAPFVVHLVDWADAPTASTVDLENATFGADDDTAMLAQLLLPDGTSQILTGILLSNGFTRFTLPALSPYGLLVIGPGGTVPEPASLALFAGILTAGVLRRPKRG